MAANRVGRRQGRGGLEPGRGRLEPGRGSPGSGLEPGRRSPGRSPGVQRRSARVTVKYNRQELQRRLDTEQWIDGRLEELYRGRVPEPAPGLDRETGMGQGNRDWTRDGAGEPGSGRGNRGWTRSRAGDQGWGTGIDGRLEELYRGWEPEPGPGLDRGSGMGQGNRDRGR
uniref:Protein phosphatase 1 regulatory subunit 14A n=1 Tax=Catharus ustulatus TaxID=91951 RepID=A0A8C3UWA9_CATUS